MGKTLAAGALDEDGYATVKLWDVGTKTNIATLERRPKDGVYSVVFSPDGKTLAAGRHDRVQIWDVNRKKTIATFGPTRSVYSVAFSPDGKTLAAGERANATIQLWDVDTKTNIATFAATGHVYSVVFSPDGKTLAAGSNGGIHLWDVSEWTGSRIHRVVKTADDEQQASRPHRLTKVSGKGQEGPASTQLDEPFVVSVIDQDGLAFAGASVSFSVTAGGGTLSTATATTDANGRAATTLTLGSQPGTNTVEATVAGLKSVTFTATAIGQIPHSLTKVSGEGQEGLAGAQLDEPFVVLVLDEEDEAIAGAVVSFSVTAGGGTMSDATATTNATAEPATRCG